MSYTFWMEKLVAEHGHFGYLAGQEALLALHVFADCKHHPLQIPWVMRARKRLSAGLKAEIDTMPAVRSADAFLLERGLIPDDRPDV
ncbi:MAG: hypothetical protein WCC10_10200 [Tumebacillaceae bacterium]